MFCGADETQVVEKMTEEATVGDQEASRTREEAAVGHQEAARST